MGVRRVGGPILDWDKYETDEYLYGNSDTEIPDEPLILLVAHSDCEGDIYPKQANAIADRLEELLPEFDKIEGGGHIRGTYGDTTRQFIKGLRKAAKRGEKVGFH